MKTTLKTFKLECNRPFLGAVLVFAGVLIQPVFTAEAGPVVIFVCEA